MSLDQAPLPSTTPEVSSKTNRSQQPCNPGRKNTPSVAELFMSSLGRYPSNSCPFDVSGLLIDPWGNLILISKNEGGRGKHTTHLLGFSLKRNKTHADENMRRERFTSFPTTPPPPNSERHPRMLWIVPLDPAKAYCSPSSVEAQPQVVRTWHRLRPFQRSTRPLPCRSRLPLVPLPTRPPSSLDESAKPCELERHG